MVRIKLTATHLDKSIINAKVELRQLLKESDIIDVDSIGLGGKEILQIHLIKNEKVIETSITFGNPSSKIEPRFSISQLSSYCKEDDILLFKIENKKLIVEVLTNNNIISDINCEFLQDLLELQQDGSESISAPKNWLEEPLLYVNTDLDNEIETFIESINSNESIGRWLFFVGAPGNGKSALTGKIIRELHNSGHSFFHYKNYSSSTDKVNFNLDNCGDFLPYKLELKHVNDDYSICSFIQDASLVKQLGNDNSNASLDLIEAMKESLERGTSLIVCANRGILEDALRLGKKNDEKDRKNNEIDENVLDIIDDLIKEKKKIVEIKSGNKAVNKKIEIGSHSLEHKSLIIGKSYFNDLIDKATSDKNWEQCKSCFNIQYCPFYQNMITFKNKSLLENYIKIISQYEVFSGQVIVFREAIAIISNLFAGNSEDYLAFEGDPCKWVSKMVNERKWFALLSKRIYNQVYSQVNPLGITSIEIERIKNSISCQDYDFSEIFEPSNDSGITRIFGAGGIAEEINPNKNARYSLNDTYLSFSYIKKEYIELISPLEKECFNIWESVLNSISDDNNNYLEVYFILNRWISANISYMKYFSKALTKFTEELEILIKIYSEGAKDIRLIQKIENTLSGLIGEDELPVTFSTKILDINPIIEISESSERGNKQKSYGLQVKFGDDDNYTFIDTRTLCFLIYKSNYSLHSMTFPAKLLEQLEINQNLAARNSSYHKNPRLDIEVENNLGNKIKINRYKNTISQR